MEDGRSQVIAMLSLASKTPGALVPITTHLPFGGDGKCRGTVNAGSARPNAASKIRRNDTTHEPARAPRS